MIFEREWYKYGKYFVREIITVSLLHIKVAQTPTTCDLQPRLNELLKKTPIKKLRRLLAEKFQRQPYYRIVSYKDMWNTLGMKNKMENCALLLAISEKMIMIDIKNR